MPINWDLTPFAGQAQLTEVDYAQGRMPNRVYLSRVFALQFQTSRDFGQPARYVTRVFDTPDAEAEEEHEWEWEEMTIHQSPAGRVQVKVMVAREAGMVRQLKIERVTASKLDPLVTLDRDRAQALIDFIKALEFVPLDDHAESVRVDEQFLHDVFADPEAVASLYARHSEQIREMIRDDTDARDLIALAHRREVVRSFRLWLEDDDAFDQASRDAGGPERAWQVLFEKNPWILGVGLGGQLLTGWDQSKLEQVVAGYNVQAAGKRTDAFLRTQGTISSVVLAEIKHHRQDLLTSTQYRPGCWAPSRELAGGIVQAQQTAYRAAEELKEFIADRAPDGSDLSTGAFAIRPRSYLVIGRLDEMVGEGGGVNRDKFRSFELHRRNLYEPEVVTFDELLARAEWQVAQLDEHDTAQEERQDEDDPWGSAADPWGGPPAAVQRSDEPPF